jgi:hypothetical protein
MRLLMQAQGLGGMGGGCVRPPRKSRMTFDRILSRLRVQKSRETGAELHNLTRAMNNIHVTVGGLLVCLYILCYFLDGLTTTSI